MIYPLTLLIAAAFTPGQTAVQGPRPAPVAGLEPRTVAASGPSYADLVDLSDAARLVAMATVRSAVAVERERSPGLRPGTVRLYIEADVDSVIRGTAGLPKRIVYLADVPLDSRGKAPKIKKQRMILFATGTAPTGQLQLAARDAQIAWSPATEAMVRSIQRDLVTANAPPIVTGISSAFFVRGSLPGEGETQIFLNTASGDPASLNVLSRPGQARRWAVAFGEILDESASVPVAGTLGWQRLACGLPASLPPGSLQGLEPAQAQAARSDYRFILDSLGPCGRTRPTE
ncbi:hypothetical protein FSZ31_10480 [Sphingorhabdus soli]|uniref:Uncharacterized protein n=1 Tax=Flavisphingopyxis soli TaxID=2601267 RepID=A0A5C6U5E6_9SPHN|nr:hypothetical protein [Sphingorhabdus soli]TXC68123.1 hypothetical protein FSZ31_10480 [Sphingorhabdus soli]